MRRVLPALVAAGFIVFSFLPSPALAQKKKEKGKFDPPDAFQPTPAELVAIKAKTDQLADKIAELRKNPKAHALLPDIEIYLRGAQNIVRFKEFYDKASVKWTLDSLDRGIQRADDLASGVAPWRELVPSNVVRGFRSQTDGTAQPYAVTYPISYGKDVERVYRVDIVLHGRNGKLTEIAFLNANNGNKKPAQDQDWVQIDIFGRGNNAYRWAGETDVFEAMNAFFDGEEKLGRGKLIDRRRVAIRGFSMGGAGTWHLGLHHPSEWCVMGPGAGFTTTHDYAWKGKKELPDYQERCLRIYDAVDYVENARMIPIVAYSGGDDAQKLAADNIENRLKELKIDAMTHLVAPGVGHTFVPEYFKKANALWASHAVKRRPIASTVDFVTYSTKYPSCEWVIIGGLETHYSKASVRAVQTEKEFVVETKNVRKLALLDREPSKGPRTWSVEIDGQKLNTTIDRYSIFLSRSKSQWRILEPGDLTKELDRNPEKYAGLQGPIDDAFATGFVCVTGTGKPWHDATQAFVDAKLKAFEHDWAKHWRGEVPITNEYGITPNEIMNKHLIVFGDPSSNFLLANMLPKLPLKWTKDEIEFAGKKYKSSEHVPVMIFPNPLNPRKYVVLNTGHTIPSEDYAKTNALLYPRLGDYAILRLTKTGHEVATAGLFDEFWQIEKK